MRRVVRGMSVAFLGKCLWHSTRMSKTYTKGTSWDPLRVRSSKIKKFEPFKREIRVSVLLCEVSQRNRLVRTIGFNLNGLDFLVFGFRTVRSREDELKWNNSLLGFAQQLQWTCSMTQKSVMFSRLECSNDLWTLFWV